MALAKITKQSQRPLKANVPNWVKQYPKTPETHKKRKFTQAPMHKIVGSCVMHKVVPFGSKLVPA